VAVEPPKGEGMQKTRRGEGGELPTSSTNEWKEEARERNLYGTIQDHHQEKDQEKRKEKSSGEKKDASQRYWEKQSVRGGTNSERLSNIYAESVKKKRLEEKIGDRPLCIGEGSKQWLQEPLHKRKKREGTSKLKRNRKNHRKNETTISRSGGKKNQKKEKKGERVQL